MFPIVPTRRHVNIHRIRPAHMHPGLIDSYRRFPTNGPLPLSPFRLRYRSVRLARRRRCDDRIVARHLIRIHRDRRPCLSRAYCQRNQRHCDDSHERIRLLHSLLHLLPSVTHRPRVLDSKIVTGRSCRQEECADSRTGFFQTNNRLPCAPLRQRWLTEQFGLQTRGSVRYGLFNVGRQLATAKMLHRI